MLPMLEIDERKTLARNVSASEKALNTVVESRLDVPAITRESLLELRRCRNPTPLMHSALEAVVLILGREAAAAAAAAAGGRKISWT